MRTVKLFIFPEIEIKPDNLDLSFGDTTGWNFSPLSSMIVESNCLVIDDEVVENTITYLNASLTSYLFEDKKKYRVEYRIDGASTLTRHKAYLNAGYSKQSTGNGLFSVNVTCKTPTGLQSQSLNKKFSIVLQGDVPTTIKISEIKVFEIEEKEIDLYDDESIAITLALQELTDISKKASSFSKSIKLPGTSNNNINFKHVYQVATQDSFRLNYAVRSIVTQNNIEYFSGFLYMKSISVKNSDNNFEYICELKSEVNTLFKTTSEKLLIGNINPKFDLDFSEYNHPKNYANISSSWWKGSELRAGYINLPTMPTYAVNHNTNVLGTGYVYPLINYGTSSRENKMTLMRPSIFIYEIFKKIVNGAGFTFTSTFLESERFKRLIYPRVTEVKEEEFSLGSNAYQNFLPSLSVGSNLVNHDPNASTNEFTNAVRMPMNILQNGVESDQYTVYQSGNYKINVDISKIYFKYICPEHNFDGYMNLTTNQDNHLGYILFEVIRKSGNVFTTIKQEIIQSPLFDSDHVRFPKTLLKTNQAVSIDSVYLDAGDIIYLQVTLLSPHRENVPENLFDTASTGSWNWEADNIWQTDKRVWVTYEIPYRAITLQIICLSSNEIGENMTVNLNSNLHTDIKQSDFLTSIIKIFNLIVDIDPNNKTNLLIEPYNSFYSSDISNDWSKKRDMDSDFIIEEASDLNRKNLMFKWTEDEDTYNSAYFASTKKTYGENEILSDINTNDTTLIQPIFAPTPLDKFVGNYNSEKVVVPIIYSNPTWDSTSNSTTFDTNVTYKPRMLYWGGLQYWNKTLGSSNPGYAGFKIKSVAQDYTFGYSEPKTCYYPYAGHCDKPLNDEVNFDLNWGVNYWYWSESFSPMTYKNLTNDYYSNMLAEFTDKDSKKVTGYFDLNSEDIRKFSFKNLIVIEEQGIKTYYRPSKIIDYVPGKLTKVELIKIIKQYIPVTYNRWNWLKDNIAVEAATPVDIAVNNNIMQTMSLVQPIVGIGVGVGVDTSIKSNGSTNYQLSGTTNFIRGGDDTLQYMYSQSIINLIKGGEDATRNFGSQSPINLINDK